LIGWHDIETFSKLDLKQVGTDVYSRNCEVILFSYAVDDGSVRRWEAGQPKGEVNDFLHDVARLVAHNKWFEFNVLKNQGWCNRPGEDWGCTMAQALAHSLPGKLELLCRILGLPQEQQKLQTGQKLIRTFSKPQRNGHRNTAEDLPEDWENFGLYCDSDVISMRSSYKKMPRVNLDACGGI